MSMADRDGFIWYDGKLVPWRDGIAAQLDRATFRVIGNEQLLDVSRLQPSTREALPERRRPWVLPSRAAPHRP